MDLIISVSYIIAVILMFGAWLNIYCRIKILESGLLSIHSCGIIWEATVLAHLWALVELDFFNDDVKERSMHGYTQYIALKAVEISLHAADIHDWMKKTRESLNSNPKIKLPPVRPCRHARPTVLTIAPSLRGRRLTIRASNAIPW